MGLFRRSRTSTGHTPIEARQLARFAAAQQGFPQIRAHQVVGLLPLPDGGVAELWTVTCRPPRDFATVVAHPDGSVQWMWFGRRPGPDGSSTVEFFNDQSTVASTHLTPPIPDVDTWAAISQQVVPALIDRLQAEGTGRMDVAEPPSGTVPASSHAAFQRFASSDGSAPALVAWRHRDDLDSPGPPGGSRIEIWDQVSTHGPIRYLYLAVGYREDGTIAAIAGAEVAPDLHDDCYLGLFEGGPHVNLGRNEDIRDLDRFVAASRHLVGAVLGGSVSDGSTDDAGTGGPPAADRPVAVDDTTSVLGSRTVEVPLHGEAEARRRLREMRLQAPRTWRSPAPGFSAPALASVAPLLSTLGAETAARAARVAANNPGDAAALFDAGYELYEVGLPELAIAPLAEALAIEPGHAFAFVELGLCLETVGRPDEAARLYVAHPELVASSPDALGLSLHYAAMVGDLEAVSRQMEAVPQDNPFRARADRRLARAAALDEPAWTGSPLRRWEAVLNGIVLLHTATEAPEEMNGRYAALFDDHGRVRHILNLAAAALSRSGRAVTRVVSAPDRDSAVLGTALSAVLDAPHLPWQMWSPGTEGTTLVAAFTWAPGDLAGLDLEEDPSVVTFAYALDWTRSFAPAPDLTGLLAQSITPAWGERMRMRDLRDPSAGVETLPADSRDVQVVADDVVTAPPDGRYAAEVREVIELVDRLSNHRAPVGLLGGSRETYFELDTLVPSPRFA